MTDNINVTPGTGKTVATDEVTRNSITQHAQIVKIGLGAENEFDNLVDSGIQAKAACVPVTQGVDAATFQTTGSIAYGSLTTSWQSVLTLSAGTRIVLLYNSTDIELFVSFDNANQHWVVLPAGRDILELAPSGLKSAATVYVKRGSAAATKGSFIAGGAA